MSVITDNIAELYYRSGTVKFGSFRLSAHLDNPELPESPWYMHYPKTDEPGAVFLPELHALIGDEMYDRCEAIGLVPAKIVGLPKGATPIGESLAGYYDNFSRNLLKVTKLVAPDDSWQFSDITGEYEAGDELLPVEDHISGGRNNLLFLAHARRAGLVVNKLFVVVDRQQGATANLAAQGVELLSIFTGDDILDYGLAENHISQNTYDTVQAYRADNQFGLAGHS